MLVASLAQLIRSNSDHHNNNNMENFIFVGCELKYVAMAQYLHSIAKCNSESHLSHRKLTEFPQRNYSQDFPDLLDIDLSNNMLKSVPDDRMKYLDIKTLNLRNNYINHLDDNSFQSVIRLHALLMENNQMRNWNAAPLNPVSETLQLLELKDNLIEQIYMCTHSPILKI